MALMASRLPIDVDLQLSKILQHKELSRQCFGFLHTRRSSWTEGGDAEDVVVRLRWLLPHIWLTDLHVSTHETGKQLTVSTVSLLPSCA